MPTVPQVPSNLIPTKITGLPTAPVASEDSLMMIVYQGNSYQIRVGDLLSVAGVPTSRQVNAGTGLTGGGTLANNVTLSVAPGGIGYNELAATGAAAGTFGDATHIPVITLDAKGRVVSTTTVPVAVSGYVPTSRQVVAGTGLSGGGNLSSDVTLNADLSDAAPLSLDNSGVAGVSTDMSRADHQHPAVDLADANQITGILGLDEGGTSRSIVPNEGGVIWCGADGLYVGPVGTAGQVLISNGAGEYKWGTAVVITDTPANVFFGGPESGPDAPSDFRHLVNADIPATLSGKTITGSSVDSTPIGASSSSTVKGTVVTADTKFAGPGTDITGTAAGLSIGGNSATSDKVNHSITFNTSGGAAAGATFDGSAAKTIDYSTVGAQQAGTYVNSVSGTSPISSSGGVTPTISISQASGSTNGYLSSTDWTTFNSKQPAGAYLTTVTSDAPLSGSGTTGSHLVIAQSSGSTNGYLSSTDWTTFNNKQVAYTNLTSIGSLANATGWLYNNGSGTFSYSTPSASDVGAVPTSRTVSTTAPLSGGGALSSNLTLSITQASGSTNGYLSSADWTTFNSKQPAGAYLTTVTADAPLSGSGTSGSHLIISQASGSTNGYLSSTDWTTFNNKQVALVSGTNIKTVNSTSLLGSGDVSVGVTSVTGTSPISSSGGATPAISISQSSGSTNGYLSSTDWTTFNNKLTTVTADAPLSGSGTSGSHLTIAQSSGSTNGYLSSTDWTTFNNKQATGLCVLKAGDTMTGKLTLPSSSASLVPLHLNQGTTPSTPTDGDVWFDQNGIYIQNLSAIHQLDADANAVGALSLATITDNGNGTINVSSIDVFIYAEPGWQGDYMRRTVPAATNLALTDGSQNFLIVSYNSGSPIYSVTTVASSINNSNVLLVSTMWREGTVIHYETVNWGLATATRLNDRLINIQRYVRSSGLMLSETTGNVITLTSGLVWYGVRAFAEVAATSASSNCVFYYHSGGNWTSSTVSTYNNTQYDDGTTLQTLSNGRYTVNWVYRFIDGDAQLKLAYYMGSGNYTSVAAAAGAAQPTAPPILSQMAILVGRIIVQKNAATASEIDSAFTTVFAGSTITDHNSLAGLQGGTANEYYHLTSAEYTGTGTGTFVRATSPTLVTPALGTPASGDFSTGTFTWPTFNQSTTGSSASVKSNATTGVMQIVGPAAGSTRVMTIPDANATLLYSGGALGTPSSGTLTNCTFPTLNQNTTGTAAALAGGAASQVPYQSATGVTSFVANGTTGQVFTSNGASAPSWTSQSSLSVGSATTATNIASGAANRIVYNTGSGATSFITAPSVTNTFLQWNGSGFTWSSAGSGTVTSITAGSYLTGGTITTSGTIAVDATSANTASKVVARDASGNFSAGTITAALSGTASTASNLANGGAGTLPYQSATGATAMLAAGTAGQILHSNGTSAPSWGAIDGGAF